MNIDMLMDEIIEQTIGTQKEKCQKKIGAKGLKSFFHASTILFIFNPTPYVTYR